MTQWIDRGDGEGQNQREGKVIFMCQETLQPRQKAFFLTGHGGDERGEVKLKGCEGWWEGDGVGENEGNGVNREG